jgi:hypothetical protein
MAGIVFDTSVWIAYRPQKLPKSLVMSAVVLQELVAGAADRAILKALGAARKQYERENRLLVPTGEDYYQAGKVLNSLLHNLKSKSGGRVPTLSSKQSSDDVSRYTDRGLGEPDAGTTCYKQHEGFSGDPAIFESPSHVRCRFLPWRRAVESHSSIPFTKPLPKGAERCCLALSVALLQELR